MSIKTYKSNIEGDLKQGSQAASIVADTRRARYCVPVGADYSHLLFSMFIVVDVI